MVRRRFSDAIEGGATTLDLGDHGICALPAPHACEVDLFSNDIVFVSPTTVTKRYSVVGGTLSFGDEISGATGNADAPACSNCSLSLLSSRLAVLSRDSTSLTWSACSSSHLAIAAVCREDRPCVSPTDSSQPMSVDRTLSSSSETVGREENRLDTSAGL